MNKKRDVTNAEIEKEMQPVFLDLDKLLVPRIKKPKPENIKPDVKPKHDEKPSINSEEKEYLKSIFEYPDLSITARGKRLFGFSNDKNNRIKKDLLSRKFADEFSIDLGSDFGGRVKFLKLTNQGYEILNIKPNKLSPKKHESAEHIWWKEKIARDYRSRCYETVIEQEIKGKCADIGIGKDGEIVAVEVELSPRNAVINFKQNTDAGFSRTIIACKNNLIKKEIEKDLGSFLNFNPDYKEKAKIILLTDFPFVKKLFKEIRG